MKRKTGEICLDVLGSQWSPVWTLSSALTAVIALLDSPEPDSPLNVDAGELNRKGVIYNAAANITVIATVFRTQDKLAYQSMCRMNTLLYSTTTS